MKKIPGLLLVGGNSRYIGKTTLACEIIDKFSKMVPVVALKVTSIYPGDAIYHGHEITGVKEFEIIRESDLTSPKDTAKMLRKGAVSSYYLQSPDALVENAWHAFEQAIHQCHFIVCESRSLRRFVEPGLFIYLKNSRIRNEKPYSSWLEEQADLVLQDPVPEQFESVISRININQDRWILL